MKVADLMKGPPLVALMHDSASSAWEKMHRHGIDHLIVVDADGKVIGVLSRQDLGGPSGGTRRRMGRTVGELMHGDVVTVGPQTSLRRAAALMRQNAIGCLPVVEGGTLVGVLTVSQLLAVLEHTNL